jgi:hypothetical protein
MKLRTKNHSQNRQYNIVKKWNITILDKNTKIIIRIDKYKNQWNMVGFMVFNATFNNIDGGNRSTQRKPPTCCKVTGQLYHIMLYTSPWWRFDLTTSVVIGTCCIRSRARCQWNIKSIPNKRTWSDNLSFYKFNTPIFYSSVCTKSWKLAVMNLSWGWRSWICAGGIHFASVSMISTNPAHAWWTRYSIMWYSLLVTYGRSLVFS